MSSFAIEHRRGWIRWALGVVVGVVVLALLIARRGELAGASSRIATISVPLAALAILAEGGSLLSYALAQRRVLAVGKRLSLGGLFALTIANDAIALSVPGEPAVSSVYRYRYYRRHGVDSAVAGWAILTLMIAQAVAMSLVILIGIVVALTTSAHVPGLAATFALLVIVLGVGALLMRRNAMIRLLETLLSVLRRLTGHPRGDLLARVDRLFAEMYAVHLSRRGYVTVVSWAASVWLLDALCLIASFASVGAVVPWRGVILAYGLAQVLAALPITPGGLGLVEGGLAVVLVAYGAPTVPTVAAVLIYRLVAYWLAIVVGWSTVGLLAVRGRPKEERSADGRASESEPG
ncbi:MAG: lysylphosphatidylglycerol synthase transmembrane domain-containing protein [Acidimicrobiales bacterium]